MKIYVAGGSDEIGLISGVITALQEAGHVITEDWPSVIRQVGCANPKDASHEDRFRWCQADVAGVRDAQLVWLLIPARTSFGASFEFGLAYQLGRKTIVSGDWRKTIFTSLATHRFDSHVEAMAWLLEQP